MKGATSSCVCLPACQPLTKVKTKYSQEKLRFQMDEHVHINKSRCPAWHSHERRPRWIGCAASLDRALDASTKVWVSTRPLSIHPSIHPSIHKQIGSRRP